MIEKERAHDDRPSVGWRAGVVAGIVGAVVYTLFVEAVNASANGVDAFFAPFRQIGAVILGLSALKADHDLTTAVLAETVLHSSSRQPSES